MRVIQDYQAYVLNYYRDYRAIDYQDGTAIVTAYAEGMPIILDKLRSYFGMSPLGCEAVKLKGKGKSILIPFDPNLLLICYRDRSKWYYYQQVDLKPVTAFHLLFGIKNTIPYNFFLDPTTQEIYNYRSTSVTTDIFASTISQSALNFIFPDGDVAANIYRLVKGKEANFSSFVEEVIMSVNEDLIYYVDIFTHRMNHYLDEINLT